MEGESERKNYQSSEPNDEYTQLGARIAELTCEIEEGKASLEGFDQMLAMKLVFYKHAAAKETQPAFKQAQQWAYERYLRVANGNYQTEKAAYCDRWGQEYKESAVRARQQENDQLAKSATKKALGWYRMGELCRQTPPSPQQETESSH